jgi:GT2 family glycosyltransferase
MLKNISGKTQLVYRKDNGDSAQVKPGEYIDPNKYSLSGDYWFNDSLTFRSESNKKNPKINAICHTSGQRIDYLSRAIKSVVEYVDYIYIYLQRINWDGSVNFLFGNRKRCEKLEAISNKIKVIRIDKNLNQLEQYNAAWDIIETGDWYLFLDDDEIYSNSEIKKLVDILRNKKILAISCKFKTYLILENFLAWEERFPHAFRKLNGCRIARLTMANCDELDYPVYHSDININHYSWVGSLRFLKDKYNRYKNKGLDLYPDFVNKSCRAIFNHKIPLNLHPVIRYKNKDYSPIGKFIEKDKKDKLRIDVVVVTHNSSSCLDKMLETFVATSNNRMFNYRFIIVDNNSEDKKYLKKAKMFLLEKEISCTLVYNKSNMMFTRAVNKGLIFKRRNYDYILLLNPDLIFKPNNWDAILINEMQKNDAYIGGIKLLYKTEEIQFAGGIIEDGKTKHRGRNESNEKYNIIDFVIWTTGALMLIKKDTISFIGGLEKRYIHNNSDYSFCVEAGKVGMKVLFVGIVSAYHLEGKSCEVL